MFGVPKHAQKCLYIFLTAHEHVKNGHFAHLKKSRQIMHEFGSGGKSGAKKSPGLGTIFGVCRSDSTI